MAFGVSLSGLDLVFVLNALFFLVGLDWVGLGVFDGLRIVCSCWVARCEVRW